jgi:ribosome-binding factor A
MTTRRQIQVAEEIQQIISVLLQREVKDPRLGFVTVIKAEVTSDLKYSTVYVSVLGSAQEQKSSMEALTSSRGFLRRELASRMSMRFVPELRFKLDRGVEYSDQINRLLNELKEAEESNPVGQGEAESTPAVDDTDKGEAAI